MKFTISRGLSPSTRGMHTGSVTVETACGKWMNQDMEVQAAESVAEQEKKALLESGTRYWT